MVPAEDDQQRARGGRDEHEAVLRKGVGPEQAAAPGLVAHEVLLGLVRAVERREVEVRRRVVDRRVRRRRAEERVRDERRERERQRRVAPRVRLELRSYHQQPHSNTNRDRALTSPRDRSSTSNTSPGSGSTFAGSGWLLSTSRAYGRPDWPSAGCQALFPLPSALRNAQGARGAGGRGAAGPPVVDGGGADVALFRTGFAPQDAVGPDAGVDAAVERGTAFASVQGTEPEGSEPMYIAGGCGSELYSRVMTLSLASLDNSVPCGSLQSALRRFVKNPSRSLIASGCSSTCSADFWCCGFRFVYFVRDETLTTKASGCSIGGPSLSAVCSCSAMMDSFECVALSAAVGPDGGAVCFGCTWYGYLPSGDVGNGRLASATRSVAPFTIEYRQTTHR